MDGPDDVLGAPPTADPLAVAVARARVEAALFARSEPVKLGRYHLLEQVGAGGMGVVWGAWDPELERRVAIKLVKAPSGAARERIMREGQALAKLSHPNVVAVHDVGVVGEQVYLVMEWVRGKTLRAFAREPRTVRELVAVYRAAGDGLAAAHRAGLIHRDFKPDNAVIGDDSRVRVLDFGLARADTEAPATDGAGTPRYMAPEQADGAAITHAADQYALCVSLGEALRARTADGTSASVPAWLDPIVRRGTAADPAQRFASMDALLVALGRDPATLWRRRLLVAGAICAAGAAFAIGQVRSAATQIEPCSGSDAELAVTWNPIVRARLAAQLSALGTYGTEEARRLAPVIDSYAAHWSEAHRRACMARERHELTPQQYERNLGCLARARTSLQSSIDVVAAIPAKRLGDAALAVRSLPDAERCLTETRAVLVAPPPSVIAADVERIERELAALRVRSLAADPGATSQLATLATEAERLAYAPLAARAYLGYGLALTRSGKQTDAIAWFDRAATAALSAGDDATFVEAYARQVYVTAITPTHERPVELATPLASLRFVERLADRQPSNLGSFAQILLANNVGIAHMAMSDEAAAASWFARAYDRWKLTRDPSMELMFVPSNLALVASSTDRQQQLLAESSRGFAAALGPSHPLSLEFATRAAIAIPHPGQAAQRLAEACTGYRRFHPHLTDKHANCAYEVGWLAVERGDAAAARAAFASLTSSESTTERIAQITLAALDGKHAVALRDARALATELGRSSDWWDRIDAADALVLGTTGATAATVADLERALALLQASSVARTQTYYQRRLARVHALLAHRLAAAKRAPDKVRAHAAAAAAWYRATGGYGELVSALDALVTDSR